MYQNPAPSLASPNTLTSTSSNTETSTNATSNTETSTEISALNAANQVAVFINNDYNVNADNLVSNSTSISNYVPSKALIYSSPTSNKAPSSEPGSKVTPISTTPEVVAATKSTTTPQNQNTDAELSIPAGNVSIEIPDQVKSIISASSNSPSSASLKLTQEDGSELPSWISINSETGSVTLNNAPATFSLNVIINSNNQRISLKLSRK